MNSFILYIKSLCFSSGYSQIIEKEGLFIMKEIREELESISLKIYKLENLTALLVTYFYDENSKDNYCRNQSLVEVVEEKIKDVDKDMQKLYKNTFEIEK